MSSFHASFLAISAAVLITGQLKVFASMCNGTIMTDANRMTVLRALNRYRSDLQTGNLRGFNQTLYPKAENMYQLSWSCELEEIANGFVQGCVQSPPVDPPIAYAFNIRVYPYTNGQLHNNIIATSIGRWRMEAQNINATNEFSEEIANFANMLNSATLTVGFSAQTCGGGIVGTAAGVFDQPFLKPGDVMYKTGSPCASDADCTSYTPASCNTSSLLCIKEATTTSASTTTLTLSTTSPTTAAPTTSVVTAHPSQGINQICVDNAQMNDRIRVRAADMHNYRRSQLAKGEVSKFNGNKLPTGANMMKLRYDCELERAAYEHAAKCSNTNSDPKSRQGVEENIFLISEGTVPYRVNAMEEAIKFWWKQIRVQTQSIGMAVTFKQNHINSSIRFFTMMAWATTTNLGCGVAKCNGNFFVVCHYHPGGNVINAAVYDRGTPCNRCPSGTYCTTPLCVVA